MRKLEHAAGELVKLHYANMPHRFAADDSGASDWKSAAR
jgi:hypothetical protein